jgi:hypothetical protein
MGAVARRKVEARFSPEEHLAQLDEVYREAAMAAKAS